MPAVGDEGGADGTARLGATLGATGAAFAAWSSVADAIELCLFDEAGSEERHELSALGDGRFELALEGVGAGQRYGLRARGGPRGGEGGCDPLKLLLDPYARAFHGTVAEPRGALVAGSGVDTAGLVPHGVVVDDAFDWGDDDLVRPRHAWEDTVLYEVHVRGATRRHPKVPPSLQGTYAGLGDPAFVSHLLELGVTTVELLPVYELVDEGFLADAGLTNYWGYNPIGFFAPTARYAASSQPGAAVGEFKAMVASLHRAGLEVVLDVVYNHTAEGGDGGSTLSLRGLDAAAYYRHGEDGRLFDTTGCGNSINASHPAAVALVVDSLRYWASACHVDGFRFDLAPTLGRAQRAFDPAAPMLAACAQDPILRDLKLVSEPWDVGCEDSYSLGGFRPPFREWNGRFRDAVRDVWRGEEAGLGSLQLAVGGSPDLFETPSRPFPSSINYVTSHDGFTLCDLVSYEAKHNEANAQGNEDGTDDNRSSNGGVEGPTDDPAILAARARRARAMLTTLLVSRGVPMLLGGDELGRTQGGNNNAYCQDSDVSWLDWERVDSSILDFCTRAIALRRAHRTLRDASAHSQWHQPDGRTIAIDGADTSACVASLLLTAADDQVVVLFNAGDSTASCRVPGAREAEYTEVLTSAQAVATGAALHGGDEVAVAASSVTVLAVTTASSTESAGQPR